MIFLFMTLTIGFVFAFVIDYCMRWLLMTKVSKKYNIEHGNFTLSSKASESDLKKIEKMEKYESAKIFIDEATDADLDGNEEGTMRHLSGAQLI